MPDDVEEEESTCPCKQKLPTTLMLECDQCETYWHTTCCGLAGLTQMPINKLVAHRWKCPRCFKLPDDLRVEDVATVKTKLDEDTVTSIISLVNTTVIKSLKTLLSPEDNEEDSDAEEPLEAAAADESNFRQVKRNQRNRQHENMKKALAEQRDEEILIEKKKDNLIIYGMPEADTDDKKLK